MFANHPLIRPLLIASGKSDTPFKSNRRYLATMLHMKLYYEQEGSSNLENVMESITRTQGVHFCLLRNYTWSGLSEPPKNNIRDEDFSYDGAMWDAIQADLEASSIPKKFREWTFKDILPPRDGVVPLLNQLSFSNAQFFLGGLHPIIPERLGIHDATDDQLDGFNHLWAVLGYSFGIEDHYNVALQPSLETTREYYREYYDQFLLPWGWEAIDRGVL